MPGKERELHGDPENGHILPDAGPGPYDKGGNFVKPRRRLTDIGKAGFG